MKLVRWLRYTWQLGKLPEARALPEAQYSVRGAVRADAQSVHDVLVSAFTLDSDWNDTLHSLRDVFEAQIEAAFDQKVVPALILLRGTRVVGASVLDFDPEAGNHLITGPAIVNEYRNRGLGAALLFESLRALRDSGLTQAHGVTKDNAPTAKFLYPKFDSVSSAYEIAPGTMAAGTHRLTQRTYAGHQPGKD